MGVKGLWTLLEPAARPVRLESLENKRLAIDASIWMYQLLKAMTDAEGNPLEDAHIIGFYRRICKLLFYGIKPVFVFDGGAPELKRITIAERQAMKDVKTRDAKHAAHQLLQTQLKLHALGGNSTSPAGASIGKNEHDDSASPTKKRKRDEYELPPLQRGAFATREENERNMRMAHPDDLRQLVALAAQYPESFGGAADINTIDIESGAFKSLSPEDQHDIIVALKTRSRQTSHNRLQYMLESSKDAMDFSKQQIDLLVKRNTLTQQWLQVTGNAHRITALDQSGVKTQVETSGRVAAERNRQYTLIKSDEAGGGWTLKMGSANFDSRAIADEKDANTRPVVKTITLDTSSAGSQDSEGNESDDADSVSSVEFEDVPTDSQHGRYSLQADSNPLSNGLDDPKGPATGRRDEQTLEDLSQVHGYASQQSENADTDIYADDVMSISTSSAASYIGDTSEAGVYPEGEEVYSDYDYDYSLDSQDQKIQQAHDEAYLQREREEQTILAMSAEEFVGVWMRAVPQQVARYDPGIYESIRCWLLETDLDKLQEDLWRANRRLDKQPDMFHMDSDSDSDGPVAKGQSTSDAVYARKLGILRTRISYLTFMSNYLTFAVRWRQSREQDIDVPIDGQIVHNQNVEIEGENVRGSPDVVSIDSESDNRSSRSNETDGLQSSGLHTLREQRFVDGYDQAVAVRKSPIIGKNTLQPADNNISVDSVHEATESMAYHDTIFEKARHLGMAPIDVDSESKDNGASADRMPRVRNIDSGSEGSIDEDDFVLVSDTAKGIGPISTTNGNDKSEIANEINEDNDDDEDLDLTRNERIELLRDEQNEYIRFLDKLKASTQDPIAAPTSDKMSYGTMRAELQSELEVLRSRLKSSKRDASGVENDMVEDIRMLLTLFGIPYVTAPMEAEAQCATLVANDLVDGMVTDDSDSFLFASSSSKPTLVYRHFFQKDKYVEMYSSEAVFEDSNLTQRDHVFLAYLMGSDYTVGIKGIGPVLAMEALAEFGPNAENSDNGGSALENSGVDADSDTNGSDSSNEQKVLESLQRFKRWCDTVLDVLPGIDVPVELVATTRRRRLAQVVRRSGVPASFPDPRVAHAYFHPNVDSSDSRFEWGFPRLDLLRQFLGEKLGWSVQRVDEMLVPLARRIVDSATADDNRPHQRQTTLENAFSKAAQAQTDIIETQRHSKRVGSAISSHKTKGTRATGV
ncbi:DNA repair protein rad2 [Coemansia sp. RSA 1200]|nr:DNA repair protein rad2 [Coemansia sp. RSA 1200]